MPTETSNADTAYIESPEALSVSNEDSSEVERSVPPIDTGDNNKKWDFVFGDETYDAPIIISPCGGYLLTGIYRSNNGFVDRQWKIEIIHERPMPERNKRRIPELDGI